MKKIMICAILACLSMVAIPNQTYAEKNVSGIKTNTSELAESVHADKLLIRLNEINDMDKTNMKRNEKKKLRKEVLAINLELRSMGNASSASSEDGGGGGGGIYLSVGAIIIIVLLLIILL